MEGHVAERKVEVHHGRAASDQLEARGDLTRDEGRADAALRSHDRDHGRLGGLLREGSGLVGDLLDHLGHFRLAGETRRETRENPA